MKIFLSWSGEQSKQVATVLHDWLPRMLQCVKPFISTVDSVSGSIWMDTIAKELKDSSYGIVCITSQNRSKPWLNFEAGALSTALTEKTLSPFLFNIEPSELQGPLTQFQVTTCSQGSIRQLVQAINGKLSAECQLSEVRLREEFDERWPRLDAALSAIQATRFQASGTEYPWLYLKPDLAREIAQRPHDKVWWVTPEPFKHVLASPVHDCIKAGLLAGGQYVFVAPSDGEIAVVRTELANLSPGAPSAVRVIEVPEAEFRKAAVTDYFVINPDSDEHEVFLELPLGAKSAPFWIQVNDNRAAAGFVARFRELIEKYAHTSDELTLAR